jgi:hypothetical protein
MSVSNERVSFPWIAGANSGGSVTSGVDTSAEQIVRRLDVTKAAPSAEGPARSNPEVTPPVNLISDRDLRGMIEIWFELEEMKCRLIPAPGFARRLNKCEERIRGAIMHLANQAATDRNGDSRAVRALWIEGVARGKAETASALTELRGEMTD